MSRKIQINVTLCIKWDVFSFEFLAHGSSSTTLLNKMLCFSKNTKLYSEQFCLAQKRQRWFQNIFFCSIPYYIQPWYNAIHKNVDISKNLKKNLTEGCVIISSSSVKQLSTDKATDWNNILGHPSGLSLLRNILARNE